MVTSNMMKRRAVKFKNSYARMLTSIASDRPLIAVLQEGQGWREDSWMGLQVFGSTWENGVRFAVNYNAKKLISCVPLVTSRWCAVMLQDILIVGLHLLPWKESADNPEQDCFKRPLEMLCGLLDVLSGYATGDPLDP